MRLRVPVVFLMKAVVKKQPVVKAVVRAHGVGVVISRSSAVMQEIRVGVNENPAQIIRGQIEVKEVSPIRQKQAQPERAKHQRLRQKQNHVTRAEAEDHAKAGAELKSEEAN